MGALISMCVCTYRRPSLARTLESLMAQKLPEGAAAEILVIDNDAAGSAREMTERAASSAPFPVRYGIEPRKGLSFARNCTLDLAGGDWLALIDDDEVAEPSWIAELIACARRYDPDALIGAVIPRFEPPPPPWVVRSGFFDLWLPPTGAPVGMGEALSGNALLRASFLNAHALRFDEAFNASGGEDSDFFRRLIARGGRIVSCRQAVVHEAVGGERMTNEYVMRRSLRIGEVYARVTHRHGGVFGFAIGMMRAACNVAAAAVLTAALLPWGKDVYYRYYVLLVRNLGKLRYYFGVQPIEMYK